MQAVQNRNLIAVVDAMSSSFTALKEELQRRDVDIQNMLESIGDDMDAMEKVMIRNSAKRTISDASQTIKQMLITLRSKK